MIPSLPRSAVLRIGALITVLATSCAARNALPPSLVSGSLSRSDAEAADAAFDTGLARFQGGLYEEAAESFSTVVESYPASRVSGLALFWRGRTHYQLGRDAESEADLRRYLALAPDVPNREHAVLLLANSRYNQTDYRGAFEAAWQVDHVGQERIEDFLSLSTDLMRHVPRSTVEDAASRRPPRNWLAPFYVQAAQWARVAGDSLRSRALARTALDLPGVPSSLLDDARRLAGSGTGDVMTRARLGFVAPTDGRFADVAEQVQRGIELALEDVNDGRPEPVQLVVRPTADDPDSTAVEIRALARGERVMGILGPLTSEFALPAGRTAIEEGVALVSPTATDARLLELGPGVFTVNALDGSIGHTIGTYAVRNLDRRRFAVLHVEDAYGRIQADAFAAAVRDEGAEIVSRIPYEPGQAQFTDELRTIVRGGADAIFLGTKSSAEALRILNQIAFYELDGLLPLGTDAWNDDEFLTQGRRFVRGYFADTFSRDPRVTRWETFSERYAARYGTGPTSLIPAWGYDAARLTLEHVDRREASESPGTYRGASALFRFPGGEIRRAVVIHRVEEGRVVAIDW